MNQQQSAGIALMVRGHLPLCGFHGGEYTSNDCTVLLVLKISERLGVFGTPIFCITPGLFTIIDTLLLSITVTVTYR